MIVDGTAGIPVRTVFLAHTSGLGPQDANTCASGGRFELKPCSTEEGLPPYSDSAQCMVQATVSCATATEFVVIGSTSRPDSADAPGWFELTEIKMFNEDGINVAPNAVSLEVLFPSSDDSKVGQINDGKLWFRDADAGFLVWTAGARGGDEEFHGQQLVKLTFDTPQAITGVEMYTEGASRALHYTLLLYLYFIVAHRETDAFRPAGTRPTTRASALMPP